MANWGTDRVGRDRSTAELVVGVVRGQIERGQLRPGQQLPHRAGRPSTCDELLPTRLHVVTQRRHHAQPRDHDSSVPDGSHRL